jgi:hypothetical protein
MSIAVAACFCALALAGVSLGYRVFPVTVRRFVVSHLPLPRAKSP